MKNKQRIRVLVTGATGFVGSNILKALAARPEVTPIAACRDRARLSTGSDVELRIGDLMDPGYRRDVVKGIDVVCNAASWASMWNHERLEHDRFYEPCRDLIEQAIRSGVARFIQTSTVAVAEAPQGGSLVDDFAATRYTGFWPHLDRLIDIDHYMQTNRRRGTQMTVLRLGHFIGARNRLGMLPALVPRLKTYLVPWLAGGRKRMALVTDSDLGDAFARAAVATGLDEYESFNICGSEFPTLREVIQFISQETGCPTPLYSVPYPAGYAFGWLMEALHPLLPGSSPFLTRSIVHLCENWVCANDYANRKLGYTPRKDWRVAAREQLSDLRSQGYPWAPLHVPN